MSDAGDGISGLLVPALAAAMTLVAWAALMMRAGRGGEAVDGRIRSIPNAGGVGRGILPLGIGLAVTGFIWAGLDNPLLAAAFLAVWTGVLRIVRTRQRRRREQEELRYAVDAISTAGRALRAGIPMSGVLRILSVESHGDAQAAFREIVSRDELGEDLVSAVRAVLLANPSPALRAFGLALVQQVSAGGNLGDVTDRLTRSLIERSRVRRRTRTLLTYGRFAAITLSALPLVAVPMLCWLMEDYSKLLLYSPTGHVLLAIAAAMLVTGALLIQRIIGVEAPGEWRSA